MEVLGHAEAILPRKAESNRIVRIDGQRGSFCAIIPAYPGFRDQAPHLASGKSPSVGKSGLNVRLPLAQGVTVGCIVVRSHARREKVRFVVACGIDVSGLTLHQQGEARLTAGAVELA